MLKKKRRRRQAADIPKQVLTIKWMSDSCITSEYVVSYLQSAHCVSLNHFRTWKESSAFIYATGDVNTKTKFKYIWKVD